jgi:hypothetical protein
LPFLGNDFRRWILSRIGGFTFFIVFIDFIVYILI